MKVLSSRSVSNGDNLGFFLFDLFVILRMVLIFFCIGNTCEGRHFRSKTFGSLGDPANIELDLIDLQLLSLLLLFLLLLLLL